MKGSSWLRLIVFLVCLGFILPAFAADEAKKDETKIKGTIVASTPDPSGKLAPIIIQTDKEQFGVINNAVAKKMAKYPGQKATVTGKVQEMDGKKVIEVWLFERQDPSGKKPKIKQPS
ncbi:MAG: hypothetical protein V1758_00765 [Pseudomonadota bacterium]